MLQFEPIISCPVPSWHSEQFIILLFVSALSINQDHYYVSPQSFLCKNKPNYFNLSSEVMLSRPRSFLLLSSQFSPISPHLCEVWCPKLSIVIQKRQVVYLFYIFYICFPSMVLAFFTRVWYHLLKFSFWFTSPPPNIFTQNYSLASHSPFCICANNYSYLGIMSKMCPYCNASYLFQSMSIICQDHFLILILSTRVLSASPSLVSLANVISVLFSSII